MTQFNGFVRTKTYSDSLAESKTSGKIYFPTDRDCLIENGAVHDFLSSYAYDLEESNSYGVMFDTASSSPSCTRIGNMTMHKTLPVHSGMALVQLDSNGNEVRELTYEDGDEEYGDPDKRIMVRIPAHYRKFAETGTKRIVRLSQYALPGFHYVPKMYVGAFEAVLDRSSNILRSFVPECYAGLDEMSEEERAAWLANYRGGANDSSWDGTYRTQINKAATYLNLAEFRTAARNNNTADTCWNCYTYDVHKTVYWLFVTEYATLNCQLAYNSALTSEGYRQGGLGNGVTTISNWSTYNSYRPVVPVGVTRGGEDADLLLTNVVSHTIPGPDGDYATVSVPKYRGIENPFGHLWKWTDGILVDIHPGTDGLSEVYTVSDPSLFSSTGTDNYLHVGNEARTSNYAKSHIFGTYGEIIPDAVGGSSSTYLCDYHYTGIPAARTLRGVLFGGTADAGAYAGLACASSGYSPSYRNATVGSRLCYIPN